MGIKERVITAVLRQFGHPHGIGGRLAGWVMAHRSSNRRRNRWVVSLLDVQPPIVYSRSASARASPSPN